MVRQVATDDWQAEPATGEGEEVITIRDLLRAWKHDLERRTDLAASTRKSYLGIKRRVEQRIGDVLIDATSVRVVERYRDACLADGLASTTIARDLVVLGTVWKWGWERGATPMADLPAVSLRIVPKREKVTPSAEEAARVVAKATGYVATVLQVQWAYGCRISECTCIQAQDVDLDRGLLRLISRHVEGRRGKTGERWVPLVPPVRAVLAPLLEGQRPDDYILGVSPLTAYSTTIDQLPALCETAKVRRFTSHAFRRVVVGAMFRRGIDIKTVSMWTGASPQTLLKHYWQPGEEDLRRAAAVVRPGQYTAPDPKKKVVAFPHNRPAQIADDVDDV
jgi:integrase